MDIRQIFPEATTDADLHEWIYADGWGGEGVDYIEAGTEFEIVYRLIRGHWILSQGTWNGHGMDAHHIAYDTEAQAETAYRGAIEELHHTGAEFLPDTCPIFDQIASTW